MKATGGHVACTDPLCASVTKVPARGNCFRNVGAGQCVFLSRYFACK